MIDVSSRRTCQLGVRREEVQDAAREASGRNGQEDAPDATGGAHCVALLQQRAHCSPFGVPRTHFLRQRYSLSDDGLEDAIVDIDGPVRAWVDRLPRVLFAHRKPIGMLCGGLPRSPPASDRRVVGGLPGLQARAHGVHRDFAAQAVIARTALWMRMSSSMSSAPMRGHLDNSPGAPGIAHRPRLACRTRGRSMRAPPRVRLNQSASPVTASFTRQPTCE
jgi:hypothetical protein